MASLETGKTRTESILEVQEAVDLITTYADLMERERRLRQAAPELRRGRAQHRRAAAPTASSPCISPFNFPVALAVNMLSAALIAGNTVVLKPSEEAPWSGRDPRRDRARRGPAARVSSTWSTAARRPAARSSTRAIDGVAFTGSAEVGRAIARKLHDGPFARPALTEMGGKNPAIVAVERRPPERRRGRGALGLRALGPEVQRLLARDRARRRCTTSSSSGSPSSAAALTLGDPSERDAFLGPVINEVSSARFETAVADARRDGEVAAGGGRPERPGHFVEPTVVTGLPKGHRLERDELFLPFVTVTRVSSFDEALAEANAPAYGLTAGVFSEDPAEKERFLAEIEAGVVYVNRRAGRHHRRLARHADLRGLEVERHDRQGRARALVPAAVHARAEPDGRGLSAAASSANTST